MKNPVEKLVRSYATTANILFSVHNPVTFYQENYFSGFLNHLANTIEGMDTQERLLVIPEFSTSPKRKNLLTGLGIASRDSGEYFLELRAVPNERLKSCPEPFINGGVGLYSGRPDGTFDENQPIVRMEPGIERLTDNTAHRLTGWVLKKLKPHFMERPASRPSNEPQKLIT